jgi:hypothetical protein
MQAIEIDPDAALASGRDRLVFQHPRHPDRLIKVMRPRYRAMQARRGFVAPLSPTWRFGELKHLAREVAYYLECQARHPETLRLMPQIHGFQPTSLGLGLVCEKIDDGSGGLAPTLDAAAEARGRDARLRALFDAFVQTLEPGHFVFRDVRPKNVVVAADRLVVVDGFGDPRPLPLRGLSARFNRIRLRRDLRRLRAQIGL